MVGGTLLIMFDRNYGMRAAVSSRFQMAGLRPP
jgi:hypothetical protein